MRRLLREGLIACWHSYGYLSPYPTIYRALKKGALEVSGRRYVFKELEGLVFEPWLARYAHPGLDGPLQVGYLSPVYNHCLCCDAFPHVCIHCDKTRAIMRQVLNYRNRVL